VKHKLDPSEVSELDDILEDMKTSMNICVSSCKLLAFNVEDIMALPQLREGKFTHNISLTNVKSAVEEVMSIQRQTAFEKDIFIDCIFSGFDSNSDQRK
jgi:hypothetical protein